MSEPGVLSLKYICMQDLIHDSIYNSTKDIKEDVNFIKGQ